MGLDILRRHFVRPDHDAARPEAARSEPAAAGIDESPGVLLADAGYWNVPQIERVEAAGTQVLVATETGSSRRRKEREGRARKRGDKRLEGRYLKMQRTLASPEGRELYRQRQQIIEPVFAQTKVVRRCDRFQRRGLSACRSEWRLMMATHNLLKLWRHRRRQEASRHA